MFSPYKPQEKKKIKINQIFGFGEILESYLIFLLKFQLQQQESGLENFKRPRSVQHSGRNALLSNTAKLCLGCKDVQANDTKQGSSELQF